MKNEHIEQHEPMEVDLFFFFGGKHAATFVTITAKEEGTPNGRAKVQARVGGKTTPIGYHRKFQNFHLGCWQAAAQTLRSHVANEGCGGVLSPANVARRKVKRAAAPVAGWTD